MTEDRRSFAAWAGIVERVLVDHLGIERWHVLAHSAGAPYALATALYAPTRVLGSIHVLAPWVGAGVGPSRSDSPSSNGGETSARWLRFVPTGVLRTAQAAEWRVQRWKLGKPPKLTLDPVGYDRRAGVGPSLPSLSDDEDEGAVSDASSASPTIAAPRRRSMLLSAMSPRLSSSPRTPSIRSRQSGSSSQRRKSSSPLPAALPDLATALLRASHAESLRGGTDDLLAILRPTSSFGLVYTDVTHALRIWRACCEI